MSKKASRIRQTPTPFQKVFKNHPEYIGSFGWHSVLPEFVHISMALVDNDYDVVKGDFYKIATYLNSKSADRKFPFGLSSSIKLFMDEPELISALKGTCFENPFNQLLAFYPFGIKPVEDVERTGLLLYGFKNLLDGRSETAILSKYLMMQYLHIDTKDYSGLFGMESKNEILLPENVSRVFAAFPPSVGMSEFLDAEFCDEIWYYNYDTSPFMSKEDSTAREEAHFEEFKMDDLINEFIGIYDKFKGINLLHVYSRYIAEVNMGFVARICNLTLDVVDLVRNHRAELAELTHRTILESFIVGSWLMSEQDTELHKRFREFSLGKDRFFGEKLSEMAKGTEMEEQAGKIKAAVSKEMGSSHINIATERGDIFEKRLDQMAESLWGKDSVYYMHYKRLSEVTHGHWRVMAKYHLDRSVNPMHAGLYLYKENTNRFAGLVPAFICLRMSCTFMKTVISNIKEDEIVEVYNDLTSLEERLMNDYLKYYDKYIAIK